MDTEFEDEYGEESSCYEDDESPAQWEFDDDLPPPETDYFPIPEAGIAGDLEDFITHFTFPGPGVLFGLIFAFIIGVAVLLSSLAGDWTPSIAAVEAQDQSGIAEILPEIAAEEDPSTFSPSAEAAASACEVSGLFPKKVLRWCNLISFYARKQDLDPDLVAALVWLESGGNEVAYSKSGAVGLMQVMPNDGLAVAFMCVNGPCFADRPSTTELQNPEFNLKYGTRMLARLLNKHGNLREALKSYGPMNVGYYYADKVLGLLSQYGQ